jgi:uncharacterized protein
LKKILKNFLPGPEIITGNRYLKFLSPWLGHPRLWHMHRRSVALGVAIGMVTSLIPGPVQILLAVLIAIPLRANVIAAAAATLLTNPFTFIPLYVLAYNIGKLATGNQAGQFVPPGIDITWANLASLFPDLWRWAVSLGDTLLIGLAIQASGFAVIGYFATLLTWRIVVGRLWRSRRTRRPGHDANRQNQSP